MIEKNWLDLKKPDEMEIKISEYNPSQAVVAVGPFERGFGVTIGNALRRVLLSSLQGAAITSVQIQGVVHEFSSIPSVREDVTDLVLNLKGVAVRMEEEGPKRLRLAVDGPATVTAGMITETANVDIMNPDHVLCHLDKGAKLAMELTVNTGKGYVPASVHRTEDSPSQTTLKVILKEFHHIVHASQMMTKHQVVFLPITRKFLYPIAFDEDGDHRHLVSKACQ